jgi:hypothetical protein
LTATACAGAAGSRTDAWTIGDSTAGGGATRASVGARARSAGRAEDDEGADHQREAGGDRRRQQPAAAARRDRRRRGQRLGRQHHRLGASRSRSASRKRWSRRRSTPGPRTQHVADQVPGVPGPAQLGVGLPGAAGAAGGGGVDLAVGERGKLLRRCRTLLEP